jgi:hypothetical protein
MEALVKMYLLPLYASSLLSGMIIEVLQHGPDDWRYSITSALFCVNDRLYIANGTVDGVIDNTIIIAMIFSEFGKGIAKPNCDLFFRIRFTVYQPLFQNVQ